MNDNIKLEVAIEIMASKIASMAKKGYDNNSKEMKKLLQEKKEMYNCSLDIRKLDEKMQKLNEFVNKYNE